MASTHPPAALGPTPKSRADHGVAITPRGANRVGTKRAETAEGARRVSSHATTARMEAKTRGTVQCGMTYSFFAADLEHAGLCPTICPSAPPPAPTGRRPPFGDDTARAGIVGEGQSAERDRSHAH